MDKLPILIDLCEKLPKPEVQYSLVLSGAYIEIRGGLVRVKLNFHRNSFIRDRWRVEELIKSCEKGCYSSLPISGYLITHEEGTLRITIQDCDIAWVTASKEVIDAFKWLLTT